MALAARAALGYRAAVDIDRDAPVIARAWIDVAAAPEIASSVISEVAAWPRWNPDVRSARIEGAFAPGARFVWKAGGATIRSTVQSVGPGEIAWTGTTAGIRAIHVYRFVPQSEGTRIETEESWQGVLVRLLRRKLQPMLQGSLESGLRYLKAEAERRARM